MNPQAKNWPMVPQAKNWPTVGGYKDWPMAIGQKLAYISVLGTLQASVQRTFFVKVKGVVSQTVRQPRYGATRACFFDRKAGWS